MNSSAFMAGLFALMASLHFVLTGASALSAIRYRHRADEVTDGSGKVPIPRIAG